ncbi:MAG: flagellar basal-body rod protein FlgF [Candidatus Sumerlaeia bacterium]
MKEMYVPLSGAIAREKQLTMVTNNLANVNSVGYKKEKAIFRVRPPETDLPKMDESANRRLNLPNSRQRVEGNRNYTAVAESFTDFSTGETRATGNPFDMAIQEMNPRSEARGFFVVQTPEGPRYTRKGNFEVDAAGRLVDTNGNPVLATNGQPLVVGPRPFEPIVVSPEGNVVVQERTVGQIQRVVVDDPNQLEKQGHGLFNDRNGEVPVRNVAPADNMAVRQRYLEMANTNVVEELVQMIDLQRAYTAFERSIQTFDDASGQVINWAMER